MREKRIRRFCILFVGGILAVMLASSLLPVHGEEAVYARTLRLHVMANSDSEADQTLKLAVRDRLLRDSADLLADCSSAQEAALVIMTHADALCRSAEALIADRGYDYGVTLTVEEEYSPTRRYGDVRMPAGRYTAVRVRIGEARGHNWWCVLYPALCTSAAQPQKVLSEAGFSPAQIRLLTDSESPHYVLRFRILEWLAQLADAWKLS